jgi:hypothetical protein
MIEDESKNRKETIDAQNRLNNAQAAALEAKTKTLADGGGLIKITTDGLEPALEMIMWNVLEKVQIQVNDEASNLLLGL